MILLGFILDSTYFVYDGVFYQQIHGCAMGFPISPFIANLYMERFEQEALASFDRPPELWFRYVDDTFSKLKEYDVTAFTEHLNSRDPHIKFTMEPEVEGKLAFLDTCVQVLDDGSTKVSVYRKPTHTDQYLDFNSNHHLEHKRSVVRTLFHRADSVITTEEDKQLEKQHLREVLQDNNYKSWIFKSSKQSSTRAHDSTSRAPISIPLPYVRGVSEQLTRVFRKQGVSVYHKPFNTIRSQLVHPKDPTPPEKKCGVIYKIECEQCHLDYIGETARTFGTRFKEHANTRRAALTAVGEHCKNVGHSISMDSCDIIGREDNYLRRKIKEAIEIQRRAPALNRDRGFELPAIYRDILSRDSAHQGSRDEVQ